jgi:Amt family ammonium transporter
MAFLLLPGYLCLEAGLVRRKNAVNVAMKSVLAFLVTIPATYVLGFSIIHGPDWMGILSIPHWGGQEWMPNQILPFLREAILITLVSLIVSGAVAERLRFLPFGLFVIGFSLFQPFFAHWTRGGGWLQALGFQEGAGAASVHLLGSIFALAGVVVLKARNGRFAARGEVIDIVPSDLVLSSQGLFLLVAGALGLHLSFAPDLVNGLRIVGVSVLGLSFGAAAALMVGWSRHGVARLEDILDGALGGWAAIAAVMLLVPVSMAPLVGALGGAAAALGADGLRRQGWDDAVGTISAHGGGGLVGLLAIPFVAGNAAGGFSIQFLAIQLLGVGVTLVFGGLLGFGLWLGLGRLVRLRVTSDEESVGMNYSEHRIQLHLGAGANDSAGSSLP